MRLIKISDGGRLSLTEKFMGEDDEIPLYAILSHTWLKDQEVTFDDLKMGTSGNKKGLEKIQFCAKRAMRDGLSHFWVDTCCINKRDQVEVQYAINSMFSWYRDAAKCYVYLSDVSTTKRKKSTDPSPFAWEPAFRHSLWFTRGWTLQELLAPESVKFFSKEGYYLGDRLDHKQMIHEITGIPIAALSGRSLHKFGVEERLSWCHTRKTTWPEDKAYSMLGIFGTFMPMLYGEGQDHAFRRLRQVIDDLLRKQTQDVDDGIKITQLMTDCLKSLSFPEQETRYNDVHIAKDTCQWLLQNTKYRTWVDSRRGLFWVKGNPGSGKSVLMKHAVTMMRQVHPEELTVSYFINAQGSELQRSPLGVIRALLNKILSDFPSTLALLTREFEDRNQRSTSGCTWGCKELQETLIRAIQHEDQQPRPVVMFVDALDELGEDDGSDLLEYFRDLMEIAEKQRAQLKICISSRHYPIIGHENISCVYVEEENREDIQCFVRKALKGIKLGSGRHRAEQDILSKAQGVFQWVSLIIRELHRKSRVGIRADSLFKELTACPPTLSDLYGALLETISGAEKHQMIRLFHWVLFAKRALNAHELRDALAVSADVSCTTMSRLRTHEGWSDSLTNFESYVKHISKGLVEFRDLQPAAPDRGRTAQFIHQTVADFLFDSWLEDKSYDQTEAAHIELSRSCLRYLTLEEILSSPFPMEDDLASRYPLASYATNNLFDHLKSSPWSLTKQCCRSSTCLALHWTPLASTSLALSTLWRMLALRTIHEHVHWPFHGAAGFHALAALGSRSSLVAVEDFCSPIHGKVDRAAFRTLYHANNYSHQELISILLDGHAELYSNTGSRPHQIRSHLISCQDHALTAVASTVKAEAMIFLSLLEADLEIGGMSRDIMLLYFAINSRSTVIFETMMTRDTCLDGAIYFALTTCTPDKDTVLESMLTKLLLAGANTSRSWKYQPNASIKAEDNTDEALQIAFKNGFAHVFNLLIELGSSREPLHIFGPSPLVAAVAMGHAGIARAILHYEPSAVELRDDRGVAALDLAFLKDRLDLAEMLLESGQFSKDSSTSSGFFFKLFSSDRVDVLDVYTGDRQSTLTLSTAERGSSNIYKFKFDADHIDVHAKDEHGQSLLWYAARGGWAAMVRLLLDTNEVNIRDRQRNTPLLIAVHNGHFPIVKLLLSVDGVDVNAKGLVKCTSLMLAVQKGLTEVVTLLLTARGVDVNTTDRFGCPLLLVAAESGHFDVVKILLATPTINIHAMDNEGSSALHYAVRGGYILIVKLLLDTGGFQNERVSLLWAAVEARKPELVLTLIGTDCGLVKVRNQHGRSLLWQVTASGDCKTLQALLALPGIDLEEKDEVGRSLLWQAAQTKNTAVIKLLLETGEFHVECTDEEVGDSALSCVRSEGDDALIALLLDFHRAMIDNGGRGGHTPQCQAKGHSRLVQSV